MLRSIIHVGFLALIAASVLVTSVLPLRACPTERPDVDVVVGIRDSRPFTSLDEDEIAVGFAVTVWERVALSLWKDLDNPPTRDELDEMSHQEQAALRMTTDYVMCDTIDSQEIAMRNGVVDVVISPLTITSERMRNYDFSQQYLSSGLALAVPYSNAIDFEQATDVVLETIFQPTVANAVLAFLSFNLLMAILIRWLLLHPPKGSREAGISSAFRYMLEAVIRTIGLRGVSDEYTTAVAKLLEIFLAVVGTALSATILGVLTTAFVGSVGTSKKVDAQNFTTMSIATLKCSTAQEFLYEKYVNLTGDIPNGDPLRPVLDARIAWLSCQENSPIVGPAEMQEPTGLPGEVVLVKSWEDAVKLLVAGDVDGVLGDWVALAYLSRQDRYTGKIDVPTYVYRNEPYGWAIARNEGSQKLRAAIDSALISRMRNVNWRRTLEAYLGAGAISPN